MQPMLNEPEHSFKQVSLSASIYAQLFHFYNTFLPLLKNSQQACAIFDDIEQLSALIGCSEAELIAVLIANEKVRNALDDLRSQMIDVAKYAIRLQQMSLTDAMKQQVDRGRAFVFKFIAVTSIYHSLNDIAKSRLGITDEDEELDTADEELDTADEEVDTAELDTAED